MTPHEKAVQALNTRLERLQTNLQAAKAESDQRFLFQALVVTLGLGEALSDYIKGVGQYAQRRHAEVKRTNETVAAQHADLLKSGQALLERLKANPADQAIRKEIARLQQAMAALQKTLRRGANGLQRDLAPSLAMIDPLAVSVRRLSEADRAEALQRLLKTVVGQVRELYAAQPGLPAKNLVDAANWETAAQAEIGQAADFYDAYARAGYQALLALEMVTLALAEIPPRTAEETTRRANESAAARIKAITARFTAA